MDFQFEGYKCDPNGEYVRRWLPELARLPTEWIHHPYNASESVLQAAGIELGSNYPLPIVEIDAAKERLEEALIQMWQQEAASRAAMENGTEEGLGDSSESTTPIDFPQDIQMEERHEPVRNNPHHGTRRYEDQMVPSITSSHVRVGEEEISSDLRNSAENSSRAEVPTNANARETVNQGVLQTTTVNRNNTQRVQINTTTLWLRNAAEDSTAESSSSTRRDGGVVPEWSPPASNFSDQFVVDDENGIGATSSYLQRHPQSHQLMNWTRLPQTG